MCVYLTIILFIQHTQFVRNECSASCLNPVQSVHLYEWRRRRASHECGLFLGQAGKRGVYASQGFGGLQDQNLILWTEAAAALGENEECMLNCYSVPGAGVFVFSQNSVVNANIFKGCLLIPLIYNLSTSLFFILYQNYIFTI